LHARQFGSRSFHRLLSFAFLVSAALVRIDDEHSLRRLAAGYFLNTRAEWVGLLFASGDAHGAIHPLAVVQGLQPGVQLGIAAAFQAHQIPMAIAQQRLDISVAHHATITDEDDAAKMETTRQIADYLLDRGHVQAIAFPHVMGDRPARHHHQANDDLHVLRLAVAAVAMMGEVLWPLALEVGAGDVEQHQVWPQAKQVAQAAVQGLLDLAFGLH
jgi:hypothetical protein